MSADINKPTARLTDLLDADGHPKIAPVQGYKPGIPWSLHLEAYDAYCKKYGGQEALIDLAGRGCRGGFGVGELDTFIPGWRDKVSEIGKLRAKVAELKAALVVSKQVVEYEQRHAAESELALARRPAVVSEGQAVVLGYVNLETLDFAPGFYQDKVPDRYIACYSRPAAPAPEAPTAAQAPEVAKTEPDAGRVMMSAHALCPTDMPHPDRMRWMAEYFLSSHPLQREKSALIEALRMFMSDRDIEAITVAQAEQGDKP